MSSDAIHQQVSAYYTQKLATHGPTSQGVDWNSTESQTLRFKQLFKFIDDPTQTFSINDYGCGYGALVHYLTTQQYQFTYTGFDIAEAMIEKARQLFPQTGQYTFTTDKSALTPADYTVASGIFNVKLQTEDTQWRHYILETVQQMWQLSKRGMAFNILTKYSDPEYMRSNLYYADPCFLFDYCKTHLSKQVALLHDYQLYEFTILVRKD